MTRLLEKSKKALDPRCLVNKGGLKKQGCRVLMNDIPQSRLIVDFDKTGSPLPQNTIRCDYLLIVEDHNDAGWVVLLELKRGSLSANQAIRQLKSGSQAAMKIIPNDENVSFRPVIACSGVAKSERNIIKKRDSQISFFGHKEPIRLMSCGESLKCLPDR